MMSFKNTLFLFACLVLFACKGTDNDAKSSIPSLAVERGQALQIDSALAVSTLKILSSDEFEGRQNGTKGYQKAQDYIVEYFQKLGLAKFGDSFLQSFGSTIGSEDLTSHNVVGTIAGSQQPDKYMVIGAHYDHVGIHDGEIYNGADDNASGVGGLLAMAKYFSVNQPKHSIIFIAFDAEEHGLQGSEYFVEHAPVNTEDIIFMLNMDMISQNKQRQIYASGTYHYPFLKPIAKSVAGNFQTISVLFGHDNGYGSNNWTHASDHSAFHKASIPYLYFGVEDHKHYHKPTDDFKTIELGFYVDVVDFLCGFAKKIDADWEKIKAARKEK